jgi:predicted nuclease with TOPRIM domain
VCDITLQETLCYLQIQEYPTKQILISQDTDRNLTQSEAVNSDLKKQLDEYKTKLEIKEEFLKNIIETQTQLQTDLDGLKRTVQSMNKTIQRLCETPEHVSTYKIAAVALSKWTEISQDICRVNLLLV